jgi:putative hemolysin
MIITIFEFLLVFLLIILNGFFSLSEIALLSVKKSSLLRLSKQGNPNAILALALVRSSGELLSAVQIGITSIGIFAGAFGGATIAEYLENYLKLFSFTAPYAAPASVIIVVSLITYLSLVVGELVPKQIALSNPEKFSLIAARPLTYLIRVTSPLVGVLNTSTNFCLRLLRVRSSSDQSVSEEDIRLLIAEGTETGAFEKSELKMVEGIFHVGNRPIRDFMTPRERVTWLNASESLETMKDKITTSDRSVFPVSRGNLDVVIGVVEAKDILASILENHEENVDFEKLIQPALFIDASVPSLSAIERLKRIETDFAIITEGASKKMVGIITFHDILEEIVGDIKNM